MSHNTYGRLFQVTTWGESHGTAIGCGVDGVPPAYIEDRHYIATDSQWPDYGRVFRYPFPGEGD